MPSNIHPIVAQQVSVAQGNVRAADVSARLSLLVQRALVSAPRPECELIATSGTRMGIDCVGNRDLDRG